MTQRITRRALLSLLCTAASGTPQKPTSKQLPAVGEFVRFADEITETPVVRLTSLNSSSFLPAREKHAISVKGRFLVFASDREGPLSPFRLDLRSGQVGRLLSTTRLDSSSLSLDAAGRVLFFLEGEVLKQLSLSNKRVQVVAENISHYSLGGPAQELLLVRNGRLSFGLNSAVLAEDVTWCQLRPGGAGCLFSHGKDEGRDLWFLPLAGTPKAIRLAANGVSDPCWSPDGKSALFLRERTIQEVMPGSGEVQRLGGGGPVAAFSSNADGSVFVEASDSKAQPTINLLLRHPAREFTLCEHKASHPDACEPVFSPDSRRVYFNSDFQGKPAIYSVNVEALIEETAG